MASVERPERCVVTPRLILKVFGVFLPLFAVYVVMQNTGLANTSQVLSVLTALALIFAFMFFCFGLLLTMIYYVLH